jgi:hypothetical protein
MPEQEMEEGLIQHPLEVNNPAYERASLLICFGTFALFGLLIGGIIYMGDMFQKKCGCNNGSS